MVSTTQYLAANRARTIAESARQEAETQRTTADQVSAFLQETFAAVDPVEMQTGEDVTVAQVIERARDRIDD